MAMLLEQIRKDIIRSHPSLIGMDDVVEKEILHHDILNLMYEHGFLQNLVFIGGTALRLCYGSSRLSEDLDFAASSAFQADDLDSLALTIQEVIHEKYQASVSVRKAENKHSDTSVWKITIIKDATRPDLPAQKMHIDVSSVPSVDPKPKPIKDPHGASGEMSGRFIQVLSLEESLADKMIAFAYRSRRIKPRDVWDIAWLKQQGVSINIDVVNQKLGLRRKASSDFSGALAGQLDVMELSETHQDFKNEMLRFIPSNIAAKTIEQDAFWPYIKDTIKEETLELIKMLDDPLGAHAKGSFDMGM